MFKLNTQTCKCISSVSHADSIWAGCPDVLKAAQVYLASHFFLLFLDLSEYNSISNRLTSGQSGLILSTDIADALTETHPRAPIVIPDSPIVMYAYVCCCFVKVF